MKKRVAANALSLKILFRLEKKLSNKLPTYTYPKSTKFIPALLINHAQRLKKVQEKVVFYLCD